ncbi:hypothetical protein IE53DRAFT_391089 [Violaceomyces palustris]|uniref:Uncharacterized protein n=1 Tax=Violaceomyces palustris TaxID=1673888 RepID=A0ACD0NLQ5_9BASI|nr:hypothetical protein IE53DRAFT_391089 [Violaceomyces palustris]
MSTSNFDPTTILLHHHHHHSQSQSPSHSNQQAGGGGGGGGHAGRHHFPDRADSLRDVQALAKLVDYRSDWYENARLSPSQIKSRTSHLSRSKAQEVSNFYEKQNSILDGWREVDLILDSRFPMEVMRRFSLHEDKGRKAKGGQVGSAKTDEAGRGDPEEEERGADALEGSKIDPPASFADGVANLQRYRQHGDHDHDHDARGTRADPEQGGKTCAAAPPSLKRSFSSKAVSALSSLWFGAGGGGGGSKDADKSNFSAPPTPSGAVAGFEVGRRHRRTHTFDLESGYGPGKVKSKGRMNGNGERARLLSGNGEEEEEGEEAEWEGDEEMGLERGRSRRDYGAMSAVAAFDRLREEGFHKQRSQSKGRDREEGLETGRQPVERGGQQEVGQEEHRDATVSEQGSISATNQEEEDDDDDDDHHGGKLGRSKSIDEEEEEEEEEEDGLELEFSSSSQERRALLDSVPNKEKEEELSRSAALAININLLVNVLLLAGKAIAVASSNSVSLIASLVDSALDLLSTVIIFATSKAINYRSWKTFYKYPVGKKRLEPLGVVIFAVLMIASFCQVLVESVERLHKVLFLGVEKGEEESLPLIGILFMLATIAIKLVMWLLYRSSRSSGVRAVAQDAENDVVFNVASLLFPILGEKLGIPALDPIGGTLLSLYIIHEWIETLMETVNKLSGSVASSEDVSRCLYLVTRFNSVLSVSAFELFHSGDDLIVEADVVLPRSIALKEAHDLGEIITYCTESIQGVERAYVHLDYNPEGQSGHIGLRG